MDKNSAIMWILTVSKARKGDPTSQEIQQAQNRLRAENNQPTVEEELQQLLEQASKQ